MFLTPGTRLGPYEIATQIGVGGMGEVYRATDTNLKRTVAIKVLPAAVAGDAERLARFQREAEVLAALNHPHIAQIHGLEKTSGTIALVMELVEGPTLADRIAEGAIPVADALPIATQIAEALEAAHERGIIHRDLKPANIKVRPDGAVKVLDFGLAKGLAALAQAPDSRLQALGALGGDSPTITTPAVMTGVGVILGTAAYMSPEQAKGREVDKRCDVWAFGCVLFEMLTGRRAFEGEDVSETLAAVLRTEPAWALLPPDTPPPIRSLLRRCLDRDMRRRVGDLSTARFVIEEATGPTVATTAAVSDDADARAVTGRARARRREFLGWALAGLLLSTLAMGAVWLSSGTSNPAQPAPEMRVEITTSQRAGEIAAFALSPDGTRLAFVSQGQVWLRSLGSESPERLVGTDGATSSANFGNLFWSPEGGSLAFTTTSGLLKRIDIRSGLVQTVSAVTTNLGGAWAPDDSILFVPSLASPVLRISAGGGESVPVTRLLAGQVGHRFPQWLPDGRHFIFLAVGTKETRGIYVGSLDSPDTHLVLESDSRALFAPPNALLFMREGALVARRLNLDTLTLEGDTRPVASRVFVGGNSYNNIAVSVATGLLAYRPHAGVARLAWVDRSGRRLSELGEADTSTPTQLDGAPGGNLVAMQRTVAGNADVWVLDTARGVQRRFTFGGERDAFPVLSRDGRMAFSSERTGAFDLFARASDGSGPETVLLSSSEPKLAEDWSPDGRSLLFTVQSVEGGMDLWFLPVAGDGGPRQLTQTPFTERYGRFSPDGRWIAYMSTETGREEVYVQSFPGLAARVQVSARGGNFPFWRGDGRELFYRTPKGSIVAVPIDLSATSAKPGVPVTLFQAPADAGAWWPSPDGQRFLVAEEIEPPPPITLILNWTAGQLAAPR